MEYAGCYEDLEKHRWTYVFESQLFPGNWINS